MVAMPRAPATPPRLGARGRRLDVVPAQRLQRGGHDVFGVESGDLDLPLRLVVIDEDVRQGQRPNLAGLS
jgi:hypothetical protein